MNQDFFTSETNINYFRIAANLVGFPLTNYGVELLWAIMISLSTRGGDMTLDEITDIQASIQAKYASTTEPDTTK